MNKETITALSGIVLDDDLDFSLRELCRICAIDAEAIIEMVEEGVVEPQGGGPREWRFRATSLRRVQIARRLQRDLRINLAGAALVLDLLEELEELRRHGRR